MELKAPGFFVWNPARSMPRAVHVSYDLALAEAKRLALAAPGEEFFVMVAAERLSLPRDPVKREFVGLPHEVAGRYLPF